MSKFVKLADKNGNHVYVRGKDVQIVEPDRPSGSIIALVSGNELSLMEEPEEVVAKIEFETG